MEYRHGTFFCTQNKPLREYSYVLQASKHGLTDELLFLLLVHPGLVYRFEHFDHNGFEHGVEYDDQAERWQQNFGNGFECDEQAVTYPRTYQPNLVLEFDERAVTYPRTYQSNLELYLEWCGHLVGHQSVDFDRRGSRSNAMECLIVVSSVFCTTDIQKFLRKKSKKMIVFVFKSIVDEIHI